jgi:DNA-binding phage protein
MNRDPSSSIGILMTRPMEESILEHDFQDREFRRAFFAEALRLFTVGDTLTGKRTLRVYVNGTIGFVKLGAALGKSPKSLMRMLSPEGNPRLRGFFEIVAYLQKIDKTVLTGHGIAA